MTTDPVPPFPGLHVGAVVYCREFIGIVTATCRRDVDKSEEVEIPHRPDGHSQTTFSAPTVAVLGWRHTFVYADIVVDWRRGRISSDLAAHIISMVQEYDASQDAGSTGNPPS